VTLATITVLALQQAAPEPTASPTRTATPQVQPRPTPAPAREPEIIITNEQQQYSGERISITLKDADLVDVIKVFATLSDLNIVLDPSVSGTVTADLRNLPWDQALDVLLKINDLGYEITGNVVYVAPYAKLRELYRHNRDDE